MPEITATEAARKLADHLDAVEHGGEDVTVVRRGAPVARLEPVARGRGAAVKALLLRRRPGSAWPGDVGAVRKVVGVGVRP